MTQATSIEVLAKQMANLTAQLEKLQGKNLKQVERVKTKSDIPQAVVNALSEKIAKIKASGGVVRYTGEIVRASDKMYALKMKNGKYSVQALSEAGKLYAPFKGKVFSFNGRKLHRK